MAHTYSHLFGLKTTGLRFFTVYGPWGRPDMAYYLFAEAISNNKPLKVFNNGEMKRDFTYIDDVVNGLIRVIEKDIDNRKNYKIYNLGNNKPESLNYFISIIEMNMGIISKKIMMPIQQGDVSQTYANIDDLILDYSYNPKIGLEEGLRKFINWYNKQSK